MGYFPGLFISVLLLTFAAWTASGQEPDVFAAIRHNHLDQLRELIRKNGPDVRGRQQTTPLIYAAAMSRRHGFYWQKAPRLAGHRSSAERL
jgi:hypothetical protein